MKKSKVEASDIPTCLTSVNNYKVTFTRMSPSAHHSFIIHKMTIIYRIVLNTSGEK